MGKEKREGANDQFEPAEGPAPGQLEGLDRLGMVQVHEPFNRGATGAPAGGDDLVHLGDRQREGFLAQHVLSGLQRAHRPLCVQVVGQRDVDDIDVRVAEQCVVGVE